MSETFSPDNLKLILDTIQSQVAVNGRTNVETVYSAIATKLNPPTILSNFRTVIGAAFKDGLFPGYTTRVGRYGGIVRADKDAPSLSPVQAQSIQSMQMQSIKEDVEKVIAHSIQEEPMAVKVYPPAPIVAPEFDAKKELELQALEDAGVSSKLLAKPDRPYLATTPKVMKPEPLRNVLYEPGAVFYMTVNGERYKVPCAQVYVQTLLDKVLGAIEVAPEDGGGAVHFAGKQYWVEHLDLLERMLLWFLNASILRGVVKKDGDEA
jgi:hypothetical protein